MFRSLSWEDQPPDTYVNLAHKHAVTLIHIRKIYLIPIRTHKSMIITVTATPIFVTSHELEKYEVATFLSAGYKSLSSWLLAMLQMNQKCDLLCQILPLTHTM